MSIGNAVSYNPRWENDHNKYLNRKLKILKDDFYINPTEKELEVLKSFKTQESIDNAIFRLIDSRY